MSSPRVQSKFNVTYKLEKNDGKAQILFLLLCFLQGTNHLPSTWIVMFHLLRSYDPADSGSERQLPVFIWHSNLAREQDSQKLYLYQDPISPTMTEPLLIGKGLQDCRTHLPPTYEFPGHVSFQTIQGSLFMDYTIQNSLIQASKRQLENHGQVFLTYF